MKRDKIDVGTGKLLRNTTRVLSRFYYKLKLLLFYKVPCIIKSYYSKFSKFLVNMNL